MAIRDFMTEMSRDILGACGNECTDYQYFSTGVME